MTEGLSPNRKQVFAIEEEEQTEKRVHEKMSVRVKGHAPTSCRERIYPFRLSTPLKSPYGDDVNLVGQGLAPAER